MSESETILRIAAKGDGVTASGRHFAATAPGDVVASDGSVTPGPHRAGPPCRHFPQCGGCQLQHVDEEALRQFVTDRVVHAAQGQGLEAAIVLPTHLSPPKTRRRATLHAMKAGKGAVIGFREERSHRIVDMHECHILAPEIFALVASLRALVATYGGKGAVDIHLAQADQGIDCGIKGMAVEGLATTEALLDFARENGLARLSLDDGYGPTTMWEPEPVTIGLGGTSVGMPQGAFLQPTADGEEVLVGDAVDHVGEAAMVADLFSGLGTFAFALSGGAKVLAVEAEREAHLACCAAANSRGLAVHALHRDLFRNPLTADECSKFDAIVLDPPRAGARDQIAQIAQSTIALVSYISCNPASWARDAKTLVDAGFTLQSLRPVGQFRWSTHVELTSCFVR